MLSSVMKVISAALSVYMILIIIRIFLTWFKGNTNTKAIQILISIVDPYLNYFRKITWLRSGAIDFSAIVGMMTIGLLVQMTRSVAQTGSVTAIELVTYIVFALGSFISFVLEILIFMMVLRLISTFFTKKSHQFWFIVDNILNKVMSKILVIFTSKPVPFKLALFICGVTLLALRIGLFYGIAYLMTFLNNL